MLKSVAPSRQHRIVISGMGIYSPCGKSIVDFASTLRDGKTGIREHKGIFDGRSVWAGIVDDHDLGPEAEALGVDVDRTAQMGYLAAMEALENAAVESREHSDNVALTLGTSHGGRSQLDQFVMGGSDENDEESPDRLMQTAAHYQQTAAVASLLGIHGPTATLSNACSSSGAAVAYAVELLRSGKCKYAVAGGADGFSRLTYSGFAALGAMADGKCAPFSNPVGLSLGDGAAFVVLESFEQAQARGATVLAELWGYGLSWDAYHITAPEPSGEGMNRAIRMAVEQAGISRENVDYVNVHGTGTRSNDLAETVGLERFFEGKPPPVSATKSQTGHMLGASSVVGLIASVLGMNESWLPPTSNFTDVRSGCDLDVIPNQSRRQQWSCFLAQSAAFAGANAVIAGGKPSLDRVINVAEDEDDIVISGIGVVSSIGIGFEQFANSVQQEVSGVQPIDQFDANQCQCQSAGMVRDFNARKLLPTVKLRRVDRVTAYATIATHLAMQHAGSLNISGMDKLGLVAGLCRGASASYEKYLASVEGSRWEKASAVFFPNLVMSSVGGQVAAALGIKGITSTLVSPSGAGLQTLVHAWELFRRNEQQDALIVVASDELAPLYYRMQDRRGRKLQGEGSVAFVLERASRVKERGGKAYAQLCGSGLARGSLAGQKQDSQWLARAMELAMQDADIMPSPTLKVVGGGTGCPDVEACEHLAAQAMAGTGAISDESIHGLTGSAEATMGFFNVAASIARSSSTAAQAKRFENGAEASSHTILTSTGDDGSHAAVVVKIG